MDSLTHAFVVSLALPTSTPSIYLFCLVLGAIIPDIDIVFRTISDHHPSLFILTHGGFTHSIVGAAMTAGLAWLGVTIGMFAGAFSFSPIIVAAIFPLLFAGACTHLFLDFLAFPGIPLFYPLSTKKYTAGIFPGPSIVLFVASILLAGLLMTGSRPGYPFRLYFGFLLFFIALSAGIRWYTRLQTTGILIPTFHPLKWLVLREDKAMYIVEKFDPTAGISHKISYSKTTGLEISELETLKNLPEVRRHRYYSYIVTAERTKNGILLQDPLRKDRILFYPPYYTEVTIPDFPKEHQSEGFQP